MVATKVAAACALGAVLLFVGVLGGYAEWTLLRCLRCGKWGLAHQPRLGPDLLSSAEWAQHSIPLWTWRLADPDPTDGVPDINASRAPLPSPGCGARGHLWLSEQVSKQGVLIETSGSCGSGARLDDPFTRGIARWSSDAGFRDFCRRSAHLVDLGEVLLPGEAVFSEEAFGAWDARLDALWQAYDRGEAAVDLVDWQPVAWTEVAHARDERMRFAGWR